MFFSHIFFNISTNNSKNLDIFKNEKLMFFLTITEIKTAGDQISIVFINR